MLASSVCWFVEAVRCGKYMFVIVRNLKSNYVWLTTSNALAKSTYITSVCSPFCHMPLSSHGEQISSMWLQNDLSENLAVLYEGYHIL